MINKPIKKLYYSISEVSQLAQIQPYVLRYWETEFPELRPDKNRAGKRIYRENDVKLVFLIKKLLYDDKYTIEGARQKLRKLRKEKGAQLFLSLFDYKSEDLIAELKKDIKSLLAFIDDGKEKK